MKELTKTEEMILLTIHRLEGKAYGVALKHKISELTGKNIAYGTLYFILDQLTVKEYVSRYKGEPTPERGGRRKHYYRLTIEGIEALKESQQMHDLIWNGISNLSMEKGTDK